MGMNFVSRQRARLLLAALVAAGLAGQASAHLDNPLRDFYSASLTGDFRNAYGSSATVNVDVPYGLDERQRYDVYLPHDADNAPIIVMVHGGAWVGGDKLDDGVAASKAAYWTARGYVFVSINYRLAPDVSVLDQASDVASAIVHVQSNAANWGGDPARMVLMGHGAGGHLVSLIAVNPGYVTDQISRPLAGAVILDTIALDVPDLMNSSSGNDYASTFGQNQTFWQDVSPRHALSSSGLPMLLVCSTENPANSCGRAETFRASAAAANVPAEVLPVAIEASSVSAALGSQSSYTDQVDDFIDGLL